MIVTTPLGSAPYVDITRAVMARFGANVGVKTQTAVLKGAAGWRFPFHLTPVIHRPGRYGQAVTGRRSLFSSAAGALAGK